MDLCLKLFLPSQEWYLAFVFWVSKQILPCYTYRIIYGLPWITMFWSWVGWFTNHFHKWHSHEWKLLVNHPRSDQKLIIHDNPYVILFLTCICSDQMQRNRWKLRSIHRRNLVVYGRSVTCGGIVMSHNCLLWCNFDRLSSERFLVGHMHLPGGCQIDYHSLIIEWD